MVFQSTHPRGVRRVYQGRKEKGGSGFNPRTREGCDRHYLLMAKSYVVSIHAPARGATRRDQNAAVAVILFQSTHPRGVRRMPLFRHCRNWSVSIHAPARGATAPLPSPLNRAFERQNARTSAFWAFFHAVFLKQTVFSLFFSQLPLRGFHWETSVSLRFPFFRFCSFLLSRGAVFQNTSGPSGSMAVLAPTCSSRFFQLAPRK